MEIPREGGGGANNEVTRVRVKEPERGTRCTSEDEDEPERSGAHRMQNEGEKRKKTGGETGGGREERGFRGGASACTMHVAR